MRIHYLHKLNCHFSEHKTVLNVSSNSLSRLNMVDQPMTCSCVPRSLPALVWHRQNWSVLHPLVELNPEELSDLQNSSHYIAGFTDASVESRSVKFQYSVHLYKHALQYIFTNMLYRTSLHTCFIRHLYTHALQDIFTNMLYSTSLQTCFIVHLYKHALQDIFTHMLYMTSLHTCFIVHLYKHALQDIFTNMLYSTQLQTCFIVHLYKHALQDIFTNMLYRTSLHTCFIGHLYKHALQ